MDFDAIVTLGLAAMFGSPLIAAPIGWVIGRRLGTDAGIGAGVVLFGLTALGAGVALAVHVLLQTAVVVLPVDECLPGVAGSGGRQAARFVMTLADGRQAHLVTPLEAGACEDGRPAREQPLNLRYRIPPSGPLAADIAARREDDPRQANAMIGVFGAFGAFGVLGGTVILASWARTRRESGVPPTTPPALSARRERLATGFTIAGNIAGLGCMLAAAWLAMPFDRSFRLIAVGVAASCLCFAVAFGLRHRLTLEIALTLLIVGGGFALAGWSVAYLG